MARQGVGNGEAVELGLREALFKDGRRRLEELYAHPHLPIPDHTRRPGEPCHPERKLQRHSRLGPVTLSRNCFYCSSAQTGRFPLAEALGLVESFSPALVRLAARAAARAGYEAASADMAALAGIQIEGRQIHRRVNALAPPLAGPWATGHDPDAQPMAVLYGEVDATGVPMVAEALAGRPGQQADGSSTTREAKLGCVFTPTQLDPKTNRPERDPDSTSDVGSFEPAADFGRRLRREALRRGMGRAIQIVFLGDGAAWLGELARVNFPSALWIVDLDQALERLPQLCAGLSAGQSSWAQRMEDQWKEPLPADAVAEVSAAARRRLRDWGPQPDETLAKQISYLENPPSRMRYQTYRPAGWFCGSGGVEAGGRAVMGQRLKESGRFWSERGARSVLTLRCALKGNRWEECWDRLNDSNRLKIRAAA